MKAWRVVVLSLTLVVTATACRSDTVELAYRYPANGQITYRMDASASARWDIGGPGSGSYKVAFEVTETVESSEGDGVVVSVLMVPVEVQEQGLPSPGAKERSFALRIDPNGEVLEVLEVDGVPAQALDPDELAFIGTYRPPLPLEPIKLHDTWRSEQEVQLDAVFQQVASTGELDGLRRDQVGPIALLRYSGEGPLVWTTTLPQGEAELTGSATSKSQAELDIDGGFLRAATSTTSGDFEVRVDPGGEKAPIVGTLQLDLDLTLRRVS